MRGRQSWLGVRVAAARSPASASLQRGLDLSPHVPVVSRQQVGVYVQRNQRTAVAHKGLDLLHVAPAGEEQAGARMAKLVDGQSRNRLPRRRVTQTALHRHGRVPRSHARTKRVLAPTRTSSPRMFAGGEYG